MILDFMHVNKEDLIYIYEKYCNDFNLVGEYITLQLFTSGLTYRK